MMERLSFDPAAWAQTELAQTSEFLMAVAGALNESGRVAPRHVDALRIDLVGLRQAASSTSRRHQDPPLLWLSRSGCEFIRLLEARYGRDRLILNLFRYGIKAWANEVSTVLNRWGQTTLKNSEMVLNRSIVIDRENQEPGDERLFSSLIVDMADRIDRCVEAIEAVGGRLDAWHGNPLVSADQDNTSEQIVAERIGMRGIAHETNPGQDEEYFVRRIALELASLAQCASHFITQVTANLELPENVLLELRCNWLKTEATRLFNFTWPQGSGLVALEVARNHVMLALSSMTGALLDIETESSGILPGRMAANIHVQHRQRVESLRGNLIADAMLAGLSATDAEDSVVALITYTEKHALSAREVIVSELNKIHGALMPRTLERFQTLTGHDPLAQSKSDEKARGACKSMALLVRFTERAQRLPILSKMAPTLVATAIVCGIGLATAGSLLSGCGLKTALISDVENLRPEIPFRIKHEQK